MNGDRLEVTEHPPMAHIQSLRTERRWILDVASRTGIMSLSTASTITTMLRRHTPPPTIFLMGTEPLITTITTIRLPRMRQKQNQRRKRQTKPAHGGPPRRPDLSRRR